MNENHSLLSRVNASLRER